MNLCLKQGRDVGRAGPKGGFDVVRYHSLAVEEQSLPACLQPIAWTCGDHHAISQPAPRPAVEPLQPASSISNGSARPADRVLMALAHTDRPHYGVQFHPESIATAFGQVIIENFRELVRQHRGTQHREQSAPACFPDRGGDGASSRLPDAFWTPSSVRT